MPLQDNHKKYINNRISYLLDFYGEESSLVLIKDELLEALSAPVKQDHNYFELNTFFLQPTLHFPKLLAKDEIAQFSIADVQRYMLQLITMNLASAATQNNFGLRDLEWDLQQIEADVIHEENNHRVFIDQSTPIEDNIVYSENWFLPPLPSKSIYTATLFIDVKTEKITLSSENTSNDTISIDSDADTDYENEDEYIAVNTEHLALLVEFNYPALPKSSCTIDLGPIPFCVTEQDKANYIISKHSHAHYQAKVAAVNFAISHLKAKLNLDHAQLKKIRESISGMMFLTHPYYLNGLADKSFTLELLDTDIKDAENLINDCLIALLDKGADPYSVAKLTSSERQVVTHYFYFKKLCTNEFQLKEFIGINAERGSFLILPSVQSLIAKKIIDLTTAKSLPLHLKSFFVSSFYVDYFQQSPSIDWKKFSAITPAGRDLRLKPVVANLVKHQQCDFMEAETLSPFAISQLENYPRLEHWLLNKLVSLSEIVPSKIINIGIKIYAASLCDLYFGCEKRFQPAKNDKRNEKFDSFVPAELDTPTLLLHELSQFALTHKASLQTLQEYIYLQFFIYVQEKMTTQLTNYSKEAQSVYHQLFQHIQLGQKFSMTATAKFLTLIQLTEQIELNSLTENFQTVAINSSNQSSLFANKRQKKSPNTGPASMLCQRIKSLKDFHSDQTLKAAPAFVANGNTN